MSATLKQRRDTAANWITADTVLAAGERGLETDTGKEKMGDAATTWTNLPYLPAEEGVIALLDAATILVDAKLGHRFSVQLTDDRLMGNPSNPQGDGQLILFEIQQAAISGGKAISWDTKYVFPAGLPAPTLTVTADYVDLVGFIYRQSVDQWWCISIVQGFDGSLPE